MSKITQFWDRVMAVKEGRIGDMINGDGYIEIVAYGMTYRSVTEPLHGTTSWVCWQPFHVENHFSYIEDPDATVEWKEIA